MIYAGLEKLVNDGLKKRGLQTETAEYMDLDYIDDAHDAAGAPPEGSARRIA